MINSLVFTLVEKDSPLLQRQPRLRFMGDGTGLLAQEVNLGLLVVLLSSERDKEKKDP